MCGRYMNIAKMVYGSVRWAFHATSWDPSPADILFASRCMESEERKRVYSFNYKDDFKASMIGRLLMRKFVINHTNLACGEILFDRDEYGKPYLTNKIPGMIDFNVSHAGDYVVLAGHVGNSRIGVDVMNFKPAHIPTDRYFELMKNIFTEREWRNINKFETPKDQMEAFYRNWALKESYVKNISLGLSMDLQRMSFDIKETLLRVGRCATDSSLDVDGKAVEDWRFEETLLDESHVACVSTKLNGEAFDPIEAYQAITFDGIKSDLTPFMEKNESFVTDFFKKEVKKRPTRNQY